MSPRSILHPPSSILVLLSLLSVVRPARADDGWSLTGSDFKSRSASLKSIDAAGAKVAYFGVPDPVLVPWDKFLQLDRGGAIGQPKGAFTLHLLSGDRIGGDPVSLTGDNLTWRSLAAGELVIPLKEVRAIARGQEPLPPADPNRVEDVVLLANGDTIKGILTGLEGGKLQVKQAGGDVIPIDVSAASKILLAASGKPESSGKRAVRVQLSDGSVLTAPSVSLADSANQLVLDLGGADKRPLDLSQVVRIEQLNGPVAWLSARTPDVLLHTPMFDVAYPPQMDRNYKGDKIRFGGREFARGIGVHALTRLTYNLDGGFKVFRAQYALSEDVTKGRVTVRILLDDKIVHEAKDFPPGKISAPLMIDLGNAKTLTLEAHPGGDPTSDDRTKWAIDTQARLNWIEPALLKEKPAAEVTPVPTPAAPTTPAPATPIPDAPGTSAKP